MESYCRCPGCGVCKAHADQPKLKAENAELRKMNEILHAAIGEHVNVRAAQVNQINDLKAALALAEAQQVQMLEALQFCAGTSYIDDAHRVADEAIASLIGPKHTPSPSKG